MALKTVDMQSSCMLVGLIQMQQACSPKSSYNYCVRNVALFLPSLVHDFLPPVLDSSSTVFTLSIF